MAILEQTASRLRLGTICLDRPGTYALFDRARNRVTVCQLALVVPFRRQTAELKAVQGIQVFKKECEDRKSKYGIVVRLGSRTDIRFACASRDEAMHSMRAIAKLLNLDQ